MGNENRTSIPCSGGVRDVLKEMKDERGQDWDSFLLDLAEQDASSGDNSNELYGEIADVKRMVEQIPEETAEVFERKYR
jgi:hypothetical protein